MLQTNLQESGFEEYLGSQFVAQHNCMDRYWKDYDSIKSYDHTTLLDFLF